MFTYFVISSSFFNVESRRSWSAIGVYVWGACRDERQTDGFGFTRVRFMSGRDTTMWDGASLWALGLLLVFWMVVCLAPMLRTSTHRPAHNVHLGGTREAEAGERAAGEKRGEGQASDLHVPRRAEDGAWHGGGGGGHHGALHAGTSEESVRAALGHRDAGGGDAGEDIRPHGALAFLRGGIPLVRRRRRNRRARALPNDDRRAATTSQTSGGDRAATATAALMSALVMRGVAKGDDHRRRRGVASADRGRRRRGGCRRGDGGAAGDARAGAADARGGGGQGMEMRYRHERHVASRASGCSAGVRAFPLARYEYPHSTPTHRGELMSEQEAKKHTSYWNVPAGTAPVAWAGPVVSNNVAFSLF